MDTVWIAYIRDRRRSLYEVTKKDLYKPYKEAPDNEVIIGIYDSQEKAEKAINIILQRIGWHGRSYRPNTWNPPDIYEYGWHAIPFNQFNAADLYSICKFKQ